MPSRPSEQDDISLGEQANGNGSVGAVIGPFDQIIRLDEVDSTNRLCVDMALNGAVEGLVVVANRQTKGRGRRGRQWFSPNSSAVLASFLFRPTFGLSKMHLLNTVVGLAALDAIERAGVVCSLKWPNDVVVGEKKIAGILSEFVDLAGRGEKGDLAPGAVVGIGVNVSWPKGWPDDEDDAEVRSIGLSATTVERECGGSVGVESVFNDLVAAVSHRYAALSTVDGQSKTMEEYRSRCSTIGRRVHIEQPTESFDADAIGIDLDGHLLLDKKGVVTSIEVGDVVHVRARSQT